MLYTIGSYITEWPPSCLETAGVAARSMVLMHHKAVAQLCNKPRQCTAPAHVANPLLPRAVQANPPALLASGPRARNMRSSRLTSS
jgi:hypothetical protein